MKSKQDDVGGGTDAVYVDLTVTPSLPCVDAETPSLPRVDAVTPSLPYVDARCLPGRKQTVKFEILSLLLLFIISSVLKDLH